MHNSLTSNKRCYSTLMAETKQHKAPFLVEKMEFCSLVLVEISSLSNHECNGGSGSKNPSSAVIILCSDSCCWYDVGIRLRRPHEQLKHRKPLWMCILYTFVIRVGTSATLATTKLFLKYPTATLLLWLGHLVFLLEHRMPYPKHY